MVIYVDNTAATGMGGQCRMKECITGLRNTEIIIRQKNKSPLRRNNQRLSNAHRTHWRVSLVTSTTVISNNVSESQEM